ncbi:MAG: hypothetical protein EOO65_01300 [Methanosarcinales archaeon]|nr:MAG: hypothetical protein EOO65_01300 [Methanosarcinales archaeon]
MRTSQSGIDGHLTFDFAGTVSFKPYADSWENLFSSASGATSVTGSSSTRVAPRMASYIQLKAGTSFTPAVQGQTMYMPAMM